MNKDTYIWGAGHYGVLTALDLENKGVKIKGFIDKNAKTIKTRLGLPVLELDKVENQNLRIIIAVQNEDAVDKIAQTLSQAGLQENKDFEISTLLTQNKSLSFSSLKKAKFISLYAGDIPCDPMGLNYRAIGLSLSQSNSNHIKHDITKIHDLDDNSVDMYQAEDVFEHIEYNKLEFVINDIFRILKPNGFFRLSVPDYRCDILYNRSIKDNDGNILFDPFGGGKFIEETKTVCDGGHVWFPIYETVKLLLAKIPFSKVEFLHYYDEDAKPHREKIDYSKVFISRTPDNYRKTSDYRPESIVVDCYK
jgi:SAM-dependent methyltransferase